MKADEYKAFLEKRELKSEVIENSLKIVNEFELFLSEKGKTLTNSEIEDLHSFSTILIKEKKNSYENYLALLRYGFFMQEENIIIPSMELLDGSEMFPNFSKRLTEEYGEEIRNEIFGELDVPPLGLHPKKRPEYTKKLVRRFIQKFGEEKSIKFFAIGLRDKYTDSYKKPRENYLKAQSFDEFLDQKRTKFLQALRRHEEEKTLFFTQKIDSRVLKHVESDPTIESGVRKGNILTITKIPYMSIPYLEATTKKEKAHYFCHNPMIREALLKEEEPVSPIFCNCSGGYYKNYWEAVLDQPVEVKLLKSVIKGDSVCSFSLQLPNSILDN